MEKLRVELGENSYDILFKSDFEDLAASIKTVSKTQKLLVVTDSNVAKLYADEVVEKLKAGGFDTSLHIFEAGEENKNMDAILGICKACIDNGLDRKSMIVALGGGVVGDMAGFAAAIYMRGIDFVQIPTTLLSQSDSSVGGKTGVDFAQSKNIIGAFHQPKLVYMNVNTLRTLPEREFISGMGEVIKHGIIRNSSFFEYIEKNADSIKKLENEVLLGMAKENCAVKADVVSNDEKENGLRAILNFGHTIGHAVESSFDFQLTHGACVGLGMCAASYISVKRGLISADKLERIEKVLTAYGFDIKADIKSNDVVYEYMQHDKKKSAGRLKFILPTGIGTVISVTDVTEDEIYQALDYIGGNIN